MITIQISDIRCDELDSVNEGKKLLDQTISQWILESVNSIAQNRQHILSNMINLAKIDQIYSQEQPIAHTFLSGTRTDTACMPHGT